MDIDSTVDTDKVATVERDRGTQDKNHKSPAAADASMQTAEQWQQQEEKERYGLTFRGPILLVTHCGSAAFLRRVAAV